MEQDFTAWVGRSVTRTDVVSPRLLAEFRATLSPFLFEQEATVAPPGFHFTLAPAMPVASDTGPDGAERKGLFLPPIALPRRMWAGGSIETFRPLMAGAGVSRTSTIADLRWKRGQGGLLCLVTIRHDIADEDGISITEQQDLIFREAATAPAVLPGPQTEGNSDWTVEASPLLLFRFSALTFNGHRIHYDLAYAEEEGYPGLLVHGPLQAALMLNLASARAGHVPRRFAYRCLAPLFGGEAFGVACDEQGGTRIIRCDGVTTAEGQAHARGTG